jgi:hypothetical protein
MPILLRASLAVTLTLAGAPGPRSQAEPAQETQPEEVARGVSVFPSLNATENLVDGNATIVIGSRAVLLVDAPSPRLTRESSPCGRSDIASRSEYPPAGAARHTFRTTLPRNDHARRKRVR